MPDQTLALSTSLTKTLGFFEIYLHWLYFKTLPTVLTEVKQGRDHEFARLSECYILGDKVIDVGFKNAVLLALADAAENQPIDAWRNLVSLSIRIIYAGTLDNAPARRLIVDMWVQRANKNWLQHLDAELPHMFVLDLSRALLASKCRCGKDDGSFRKRINEYYEE
jgi:hypothetical protein